MWRNACNRSPASGRSVGRDPECLLSTQLLGGNAEQRVLKPQKFSSTASFTTTSG